MLLGILLVSIGKGDCIMNKPVPTCILKAFGFRRVVKSDITPGSGLAFGDWIMEGENLFYSPQFHCQERWAKNLVQYLKQHSLPMVLQNIKGDYHV